ncbi:GntR family transcriptional regulator [Microbacterium excoecariae]|uniref:GntR family transcriptional regulator n=1 Tax=Microbacterium excoecariae TaxID=2715210 RepID=UPI00140D1B37|nr:GntR family transcriptional regulator [Microbacterium excoecariae]NHI16271.1 GntR family transcriptional regulator [Microbacterium excoecariae]
MATETPVWPDELFADLDRTGPVPLYFQISSRLESAIRSGAIPAGARLENEISIGQRLGLSRPTIRRAIQEVVDKGLLVRRRGIGTQVVQGQVTREVELTSLYEDLKGSHLQPGTRILARDLLAAPEPIAEKLGVAPGTPVVRLRRLRTTDGTPMAILENFLPSEFDDITSPQLESDGLYTMLRARGVTIRVAKQHIGARRAHDDEAGLLDIDQGGPLLTMERVAYDASGVAVEYGRHVYRPDMYSFETTLVAK